MLLCERVLHGLCVCAAIPCCELPGAPAASQRTSFVLNMHNRSVAPAHAAPAGGRHQCEGLPWSSCAGGQARAEPGCEAGGRGRGWRRCGAALRGRARCGPARGRGQHGRRSGDHPQGAGCLRGEHHGCTLCKGKPICMALRRAAPPGARTLAAAAAPAAPGSSGARQSQTFRARGGRCPHRPPQVGFIANLKGIKSHTIVSQVSAAPSCDGPRSRWECGSVWLRRRAPLGLFPPASPGRSGARPAASRIPFAAGWQWASGARRRQSLAIADAAARSPGARGRTARRRPARRIALPGARPRARPAPCPLGRRPHRHLRNSAPAGAARAGLHGAPRRVLRRRRLW